MEEGERDGTARRQCVFSLTLETEATSLCSVCVSFGGVSGTLDGGREMITTIHFVIVVVAAVGRGVS